MQDACGRRPDTGANMYRALRTFLLPGARCWDADSERSYQDLFERLDTNKDGKVDVAELRAGLKAMGIFRLGAAQVSHTHLHSSRTPVVMEVLLRPAGLGHSACWNVFNSVIVCESECPSPPEESNNPSDFILLTLAENRVLWRPKQGWMFGLQRVLQVSEGSREEATADFQEPGQEQRW